MPFAAVGSESRDSYGPNEKGLYERKPLGPRGRLPKQEFVITSSGWSHFATTSLDWSPLGPMGRLPEQEFATTSSVLFFLFVFFIIDQSNFGCKNNTFLSIKYAKIENVTSEKRVFTIQGDG